MILYNIQYLISILSIIPYYTLYTIFMKHVPYISLLPSVTVNNRFFRLQLVRYVSCLTVKKELSYVFYHSSDGSVQTLYLLGVRLVCDTPVQLWR